MHAFYQKPSTSQINRSIKAETKCVMLAIQHSSSFNISHHLPLLIRSEFKGSQAIENFLVVGPKQQRLLIALGIISSKS